MSTAACANCGAHLTGPYCASCGQAASAAHPPTLHHLAHELSHELTHVDGKIWRTVTTLFTSPGTLTREYWEGRRAGWIGPFRIFLIAAALHAFVVHGIGPMNLQTLVQRLPDGSIDVTIGGGTDRRRGRDGAVEVGVEEAEAYQVRLRRAYLAVRYLAVPVFALAPLALYRRRQPYYAAHVVLAVHFYSFWYVLSVLASQLPYRPGALAGVTLSAIYLFVSLRRLFGETAARTALKTAGLYAVMVVLEMALALAAGLWVIRSQA